MRLGASQNPHGPSGGRTILDPQGLELNISAIQSYPAAKEVKNYSETTNSKAEEAEDVTGLHR
jgi:hypothetical protein